MSKTTWALLIKFAATLGMFWIALGFIRGNTFTWILIAAIVGTAINYIVGDLFVLPKFGNVLASFGDGAMAALIAYVVNLFTLDLNVTSATLFFLALVVAIFEYFFHIYLMDTEKVAPKEK